MATADEFRRGVSEHIGRRAYVTNVRDAKCFFVDPKVSVTDDVLDIFTKPSVQPRDDSLIFVVIGESIAVLPWTPDVRFYAGQDGEIPDRMARMIDQWMEAGSNG